MESDLKALLLSRRFQECLSRGLFGEPLDLNEDEFAFF